MTPNEHMRTVKVTPWRAFMDAPTVKTVPVWSKLRIRPSRWQYWR